MPLTNQLRDDILASVPSLRAFAISLSGNGDRADDLVQETLLRAIANIDSFQPGSNVSMFAIARRSVSCTRSSARSTLPLSEIAKARKLGTAESIASRTSGAKVISSILCLYCLCARRTAARDP